MTKICFKCKKEKTLDSFYRHPEMKDGRVNKCIDCNKVDVRTNYTKKKTYYRQYDKNRQRYSFERIFQHKYSMMKQAVEGRSVHPRSCRGKELCAKTEFILWCRKNISEFKRLHREYVESGFDKKKAPSVDRINPNRGYSLDNIQWLSLSDNCKRKSKSI